MLPILAAILTGYALGVLIPRSALPYLLCLPASPIVQLLMNLLFRGMQMPDIGVLAVASLLKVPVLMLGVLLARRNAARNTFSS
ncbi:hypothetical protein SRABI118_03608 [Massilia sp. Bi118]|uniref:hypothetical protein n=1 Tax=Massilia sp. Bi118 TaxID=2822346 RepID=UPI001DE9F792|nr:hypothetical protein [Massilia sp. Bi118]CAH0275243.1 hypothetical protein SRABI118_03608 [Massilia sp. Bi118]